MRAIVIEATARRQLIFRRPSADEPWQRLGLIAGKA
jgi:hypothetical protein